MIAKDAASYHKSKYNDKAVVDTEPDDWLFTYDVEAIREAALNWIISETVLPPTQEQVADRNPIWDAEVRLYRTLFDFHLDGLGKPKDD